MNGVSKLLFLFLFCIAANAHGQEAISVKGLELSGDLHAWYDREAGLENTPLEIGTLGDTEKRASSSHPYFSTNRWKRGNLMYRNQYFQDIPMVYNIEKDVLTFEKNFDNSLPPHSLELVSNQVAFFVLFDKRFEYLEDKVDRYTSGFFEILYDGKNLQLLVKRAKFLKIDDSSKLSYLQQDRYYLKKENEYYLIKRLSNVTRQFKEERKEIQRFVRGNNIQILKPETDLKFTALIEYCNGLTE